MHVFLAGVSTQRSVPAKRIRRSKTIDYRDHYASVESIVSAEDLLAANLTKQCSSLAVQAEILQIEKKKAEFAMQKVRNLCEISKINLEKAGKIAEIEMKSKQTMLDSEEKHQQEMFALEMNAKKRDLNLI